MMWGWGYGPNMVWMWLWGLLMLLGIAVLVFVAVRLFSGGGRGAFHGGGFNPTGHPGPGGPWPGRPTGRSRARQILDERFASGELTAEQYQEQVRVLGEEP